MLLVVVALLATMTMGRSAQMSAGDTDSLDEPRFSLRQVLSLVNAKRTSVHSSHGEMDGVRSMSVRQHETLSEESIVKLFICHTAERTVSVLYLDGHISL